MKNILLILMLSLTSLASCQISSNIIPKTAFYNIKINNITLNDIQATTGIRQQVRDLIPAIIQNATEEPEEDNYYSYKYDGFNLAFEENEIIAFKIIKNNWNITIQGITITIGDNISALGNVVFNTDADGGKSIVYQYCDGCNNFIYIDFDQQTNKITKIGFIEQT
ncbi:hypothetical protein [Polaribacter sp. IC063]|uniref:hypothetical protein n=1 Tax=Polaribacter sp. IC063 TaxID=57031 RepID=UPI0011BE5C9E|nr:hypothetical protein [Polaribacter sp. IC063]TXD47828.1 hypothetical protein ES043_18065 [Polaribacter sp. IC063]